MTLRFEEWVEREYGCRTISDWELARMEAAWNAAKQEDDAPSFHISISDTFAEHRFPLDLPDSYSIGKIYEEICKGFGIAERPQGIRRRR